MRNCTRFALAALMVLCSTSVGHTIPQLINYQGILTDGGGTPITVASNVEFRIWDMSAAGAELWMETQSVTPDSEGRFTVLLGSVNPIPDSALAAADAYLGMTIFPDGEMSPRTQLVAVPYAFRPGTVDGATGGVISGDVAIQSDLTVSGKATIGPGHTNTGLSAFVAGSGNTASGEAATVGGGKSNFAQEFSTVSGGLDNTASLFYCTIGGGRGNTANASNSTVGGGSSNTASGSSATVGGGQQNTANGLWSTVPGGLLNTAAADYSLAAGRRAKANHDGTFVWADDTNDDFASTGVNQFLIRAGGGVGIGTAAPEAVLHLYGPGAGFGQGARIVFGDDYLSAASGNVITHVGEFGWETETDSDNLEVHGANGIHFTIGRVYSGAGDPVRTAMYIEGATSGDVGIGTTSPNYKLDVRGTIGNNATMYHSDRRWKSGIRPLSQSLDHIQRLQGVSYEWKRDEFADMNFPEGRHIGVIAQDVEAVIPEVVHTADDGYKSVEYAKLVAVLIEAVKEQQTHIKKLEQRVQDLEREM